MSLGMYSEDGTTLTAHLRRPIWWLEQHNANSAGNKTWLHLPEMGISGTASVTDIAPSFLDTRQDDTFEELGEYVYRPIIGWLEWSEPQTWDFIFSSGDTISATPGHPFFSEDRQSYVAASGLRLGENIKSHVDATLYLIGKNKQEEKCQKVYNIEVWRDHNYLVGKDEILVHNSCTIDEFLALTREDQKQVLEEAWKKLKGQLFIERNWMQDLMFEKFYKGADYLDANVFRRNFKAVDFYKLEQEVSPNEIIVSEAISMKTTTVATPEIWLSNLTNQGNIENLEEAIAQRFILHQNHVMNFTIDLIPEIHVFWNAETLGTNKIAWEAILNNSGHPGIKFKIFTLEEKL